MHKRIARITKLGSKNNSVNRIIVSLTSKRSNGVCIKKLGCVIIIIMGIQNLKI